MLKHFSKKIKENLLMKKILRKEILSHTLKTQTGQNRIVKSDSTELYNFRSALSSTGKDSCSVYS